MTTKVKIIAGFVVMILLIGVVAGIGYSSLLRVDTALTEYSRLALLNVRTSDMVAHQLGFAGEVRRFLTNGNTQVMETARNEIRANQELVADSHRLTVLQSTKDALTSVEERAATQLAAADALEQAVMTTRTRYEQMLLPAEKDVSSALVEMGKAVLLEPGNEASVSYILETLDHMAVVRAAFSQLAYTLTRENAAAAATALEDLGGDLNRMRPMVPERGREYFTRIQQSYNDMQAISASIQEAVATGVQQDEAIVAMNTDLRGVISAVSTNIDKMMNEQDAHVMQTNAASRGAMMAAAAAGLLIGILLAVVIIMGLVRTLRNLGGFANAIAGGDFLAKVNINEKGEIGQMLTAMRRIPDVLEGLIGTMRKNAGAVMIGEYHARLVPAEFSGEFSTLAGSINAMCNAYTKILDTMPLALFTGDPDKKIIYANELATAALGGEKIGQSCANCFNTVNCTTKDCFAVRVMAEKHSVTGEVTIRPASGGTRELNVTAQPLLDEAGFPRGFMEICIDITESKQRQRQIQSVTEQAASISQRVAAASEQLSAQVEEVSRGADMQRSRVESTASAMTEMNSTVLEVARNAGQASEQSDLTKNKAGEGASLVSNVVSSINLVNKVAVNLQTNMTELGTQAESIGGVMNVISDIADQTNLLALNAAIEAARAGEAGRGFAVVADEVRKLAEKTMAATQEVGSSITAIQNSARTNIEEVNAAAKAVTEATDLANTSGQALEEIVNLASANSAVVASIATAAEQQSATSEEINRAIEEINRIVADTADGMVQSSSAVQELSRMAQELNKVMSELK